MQGNVAVFVGTSFLGVHPGKVVNQSIQSEGNGHT